MNKKLVAVAIAGLLAAPLAQAQTANVTLYGRLNMDFEFVNGRFVTPVGQLPAGVVQPLSCTVGWAAGSTTGCITQNPTQYRVSSNSSRFGLRGTESLGGGLNAVFQIESSVSRIRARARWPAAIRSSASGFWGLPGSAASTLRTTTSMKSGVTTRPSDGIMATSAIWAQGWTTKQTVVSTSASAIRFVGIRR
jgi:hypothetical protein